MSKKFEQATFDINSHTYKSNGKSLISVTKLLKNHNLAPTFDDVDPEVLKKACERGTLIHSEIQKYITEGQPSFLHEVVDFAETSEKYKFSNLQSETIVNNDMVAGMADLICDADIDGKKCKILVDYKTSATLDFNYVTWQTSIYAYLYNALYDVKIDSIYALHFGKNGTRFIQLHKIDDCEIEKLFACEAIGEIYTQKDLMFESDKLEKLKNAEENIIKLEQQLKQYKLIEKQMKTELIESMEKQNIKNYDNGKLRITYVAPSRRTIIDTTRLKNERPEVAEEYKKVCEIEASVRITLREYENGNGIF